MIREALQMQFATNLGALKMNLEGITQEESTRQPEPGGNCLNWVVGHIASSREGVLRLLGADPVRSPEETERYKRGSEPVTGAGGAMDLAKMMTDLERAQAAIERALREMRPSDFEKTVKKGTTVAVALAGASFHESYHVGQTGTLRRLVGKPGAIR